METIRTYLENMFLSLPRTKDVLKAKEELLSMMEDKYSELKSDGKSENEAVGIVIAEFGNLQELADEFGIVETLRQVEDEPMKKVLGISTVKDFIDNRVKASLRIATGVLLCIWAPILIIIAGTMENAGYFDSWALGGNGALAVGLVVLFVMAAAGVGLFIMSGAYWRFLLASHHHHLPALEFPYRKMVHHLDHLACGWTALCSNYRTGRVPVSRKGDRIVPIRERDRV